MSRTIGRTTVGGKVEVHKVKRSEINKATIARRKASIEAPRKKELAPKKEATEAAQAYFRGEVTKKEAIRRVRPYLKSRIKRHEVEKIPFHR